MKTFVMVGTIAAISILVGCSASSKRDAKVYSAGEKAVVDRVTYNVVDTQTLPKLEDSAGGEARVPNERFYLTQISVFNGGNSDFSLPTLTIVDDSGKSYTELADGRGVEKWIGVSRKLGPGETLQGSVAFDAPVKHYKLRVSDEFADQPVYIDMPLAFVHEQGDLVPQTLPKDDGFLKVTPSQAQPTKK